MLPSLGTKLPRDGVVVYENREVNPGTGGGAVPWAVGPALQKGFSDAR